MILAMANDNESCLVQILLAPFRLVWWILKIVIGAAIFAITFGAVSDWWDNRNK